MKKLNHKQQIALDGELLVASYLPGRCATFNKETESYLPFDIFWKGIKVDVKSTTIAYQKYCSFSLAGKIWDASHDTILVFVYICEPHRFWVSHSSQKQKSTKLIGDAIKGYSLSDAIINEYHKHSLLHKKTVDKQQLVPYTSL